MVKIKSVIASTAYDTNAQIQYAMRCCRQLPCTCVHAAYLIAQVYDSSDQPMPNWNAIVAGMLITMVNIVIGYTQID